MKGRPRMTPEQLGRIAEAASAIAGIERKHIRWKKAHPRVRLARQLFCLYAHVVGNQPFYHLSGYLHLHKDGARMLFRTIAAKRKKAHIEMIQAMKEKIGEEVSKDVLVGTSAKAPNDYSSKEERQA